MLQRSMLMCKSINYVYIQKDIYTYLFIILSFGKYLLSIMYVEEITLNNTN